MRTGMRYGWLLVLWVIAAPALAAERVALVIGNNAYRPAPQGRGVPPLNNARNDARAVAAKLRSDPLGFEVIEAYDLTQEQMAERLAEFGQRLTATGRIGFFYYAGHGAQLRLGVGSEARDENLLMGVDVDVSTTVRLERGSLKLSEVLSSMRGAGRPVNVVVLDACRDNPASDSRGSRGLAEVGGAGSGFLIQYATAANRTASDGPPGSNGAYTQQLLSWLDRPGLSLGDVFTEVAGAVKRGTGQEPWMSSTIGERVFLAGSAAPVPVPAPAVATPDAETVFWQSTEALGNDAAYRAYLERYPGGQFAALARLKLTPVVPSPAVAPTTTPAASGGRFSVRPEGVYDAEQGVIWAASDNGSDINWNAARSYCTGKGAGWSLPTVAQLQSLYDASGTARKATNGLTIQPATALIRFWSGWFWSSETSGSSEAFLVDLTAGFRGAAPMSSSLYNRALCVRRP